MVHEIQGGAPGPAVCLLSGYGYELRSQLRVPRAFSWEQRTEREVAVHLRDPASWAYFPAPLQGGSTWGVGPRSLPPPPSPSPSEAGDRCNPEPPVQSPPDSPDSA